MIEALRRRIVLDSILQAKYDKENSKVNKRKIRFIWDSLLYQNI